MHNAYMHNIMESTPLRHRRFFPEDEVVPGVIFGRQEWVASPAFWAAMVDLEGDEVEDYVSPSGTPLADDLAFCLLGGYGVKMELNRAAWLRLHEAGVLSSDPVPGADEIEELLSAPLEVNGKLQKYRYPRQRAHRLNIALNAIRTNPPSADDPYMFREQLMELPGIGPKTASWIARNWLGSDDVAILDVHVLRAGTMIGLFPENYRLPKDYQSLERRFLAFASALNVKASVLDAIMWREIRILFR
jgi:thermostable 8-oxoguanine DNA glycosylase